MADTHAPTASASTAGYTDRSTALGAVYGAICLAGCPRSKNWLLNFIRELGWASPRGVPFTLNEIEIALGRLIADQSIALVPGLGFNIDGMRR